MHRFVRHTIDSKCIQQIIIRKFRGRKREIITDAEAATRSFAPKQVTPKAQQHLTDHPLHKPLPQQALAESALFSVSEEKMKELAQNMQPVTDSQITTHNYYNVYNDADNDNSNVKLRSASKDSKFKSRPNFNIKTKQDNYTNEVVHKLHNHKKESKIETITLNNQNELLAENVTPFWKMSYTQQLQEKERRAWIVLNSLKKRLKDVSAPQPPAELPKLPCPLQPIISSTEELQYRNMDEFMAHRGLDGNPKTVGFIINNPDQSRRVCVSPQHLNTIRDGHKLICAHFEHFIRNSDHPTCLHPSHSPGVWRSLVVRSNDKGEMMAVVVIHPHTLSQSEESAIESDLKDYFSSGPGSEVGLTSLHIQTCSHIRCSREKAPYRLLFGAAHLTDTIGDLSVTVAPDTNIQINSRASQELYSIVKQVVGVSTDTTLLELNCGSGIISLLLAGKVRGAVGIEASAAAVEDANENARRNGVSNVTFIAGAVDEVLPQLIPELSSCGEVVAVVNGGRKGLHPKVIHILRANRSISKLLYLSSRPQGYALDNFVSLGNCKKGNRLRFLQPFLPQYAFTVDTCPQTDQYQMGVLFVRDQS